MLADALGSTAVFAGGPIRMAVVGDCLFDVSVRALGALSVGADAPAEIELLPGGQGANVAVRIARRGGRVRLLAPLADDGAGALLRDRLAREGVEVVPLPAARTGMVVALVDEAGERTMLSSRAPLPRGVTVRHELQRQLTGIDWVHLCGQVLCDLEGGDAVAAVAASLPPGVTRSADAGSLPADAAGLKRYRERLARSGSVLLFAGRAEAAALVGAGADPDPTLAALARQLATLLRLDAIVTGGASGSAASVGKLSVAVPAYAPDAPVVDATGAGDAYAAAVIARLAGRRWPPGADTLRAAMLAGSELGSRVARVRGAQAAVLGESIATAPGRR